MLKAIGLIGILSIIFGFDKAYNIPTGIYNTDLAEASSYASWKSNELPSNTFVKCIEAGRSRYCSSLSEFQVRRFYPLQLRAKQYTGYLANFQLYIGNSAGQACGISYHIIGEYNNIPGEIFSDRTARLTKIQKQILNLHPSLGLPVVDENSPAKSVTTISIFPNPDCVREVMGLGNFRQHFSPSADGARIIVIRHVQPRRLTED